MRMEEDKLVSALSEIDLVLGGHDHEAAIQGNVVVNRAGVFEGGVRIVKSGTDFRSYSVVTVQITRHGGKPNVKNVQGNLHPFSID